MKKVIFAVLILACILSLTSCKVNWFGEKVDVEWYVVAVPVTVLFVVIYFLLISTTFVCPNCKEEFKPKWYDLSVCVHLNKKRIVKCPKCGRRGFCEQKKK